MFGEQIALSFTATIAGSPVGIYTSLSVRVSRCTIIRGLARGNLGFQAMAKEESPLVAMMADMTIKQASESPLEGKMADMTIKDTPEASEMPLFSFGVITDIQYADIADGKSFQGVPRYYRHSLECVHRAVESWNSNNHHLAFAIHFGDIVDGFCPKQDSRAAFDKVLRALSEFQNGSVYHMIGNHCLYNLPREDLNKILSIPTSANSHSYYSFSPHPKFRFLVLDGYDVSALGWPEDHPHTKLAAEILTTRNPNVEKNSPEGLEGVDRRFVKFNGGVGEDQLQWLEQSLREAESEGQKVVICCHLPLDPGAAFPSTLLWNYDEVMAVVHKFGCVVACIAGHAHDGGHSVDKHGVHHHVLEAVLECPPGTDAFGYVDVFRDRLCLWGTGRMASVEMVF